MKRPATTSQLLALQEATNVELNARLRALFHRYRSAAFIGRTDQLFTEHWTPERAAAGYDFENFELTTTDVFLHGVEHSAGFVYRISIGIPLELIDHPAAIEDYFRQLREESKSNPNLSRIRPSGPTQ